MEFLHTHSFSWCDIFRAITGLHHWFPHKASCWAKRGILVQGDNKVINKASIEDQQWFLNIPGENYVRFGLIPLSNMRLMCHDNKSPNFPTLHPRNRWLENYFPLEIPSVQVPSSFQESKFITSPLMTFEHWDIGNSYWLFISMWLQKLLHKKTLLSWSSFLRLPPSSIGSFFPQNMLGTEDSVAGVAVNRLYAKKINTLSSIEWYW